MGGPSASGSPSGPMGGPPSPGGKGSPSGPIGGPPSPSANGSPSGPAGGPSPSGGPSSASGSPSGPIGGPSSPSGGPSPSSPSGGPSPSLLLEDLLPPLAIRLQQPPLPLPLLPLETPLLGLAPAVVLEEVEVVVGLEQPQELEVKHSKLYHN